LKRRWRGKQQACNGLKEEKSMGISSDTWFSTITQEWYGSTFTPDQFQQMWAAFLSSPAVKYLPANATDEDYRRLFLQFIAPQICSSDPWFTQITQAAYGNSLTNDQVREIIKSFLALPQVIQMAQPASQSTWHSLYATFIGQIILSQNSWFENAITQFYGETTPEQMEQILMDFLTSDTVKALPSTAIIEDYQRLFMQYLTSSLEHTYQVSAATAVSPDTVIQSEVLSKIYDLLSQMITTTSIAQIRDGEVMLYLTQKKNEYGKMLASIPLYAGSGTVDQALNKTLTSLHLEGQAVTTNLNTLTDVEVDRYDESLSSSVEEWTGYEIETGSLEMKLENVLQGLADQMTETGETTAYYDSPAYTDSSGSSIEKKLIIRVTANSGGTYSVAWNTRPADDGTSAAGTDALLTNWNSIGTFSVKASTEVTSHPVEISSADAAYTQISPNSDPTQFTLGYGNITLQDLAESVYNSYNASTPSGSNQKSYQFALNSGTWYGTIQVPTTDENGNPTTKTVNAYFRNRLTINVSCPTGGQPIVTASLVQQDVEATISAWGSLATPQNDDGTINWNACTNATNTTLASQTTNVTSSDKTVIVNTINSDFLSVWAAGKANGSIQLSSASQLNSYEQSQSAEYQKYAMAARDPKIPWQPGILGSAFKPGEEVEDYNSNTVFSLNASARAQHNQRLQSYLSAISGRMDALGNLNDQQLQEVSVSTSGLKATNNIINALIQQMMQILSSMFR
jgi:hypothetical protein